RSTDDDQAHRARPHSPARARSGALEEVLCRGPRIPRAGGRPRARRRVHGARGTEPRDRSVHRQECRGCAAADARRAQARSRRVPRRQRAGAEGCLACAARTRRGDYADHRPREPAERVLRGPRRQHAGDLLRAPGRARDVRARTTRPRRSTRLRPRVARTRSPDMTITERMLTQDNDGIGGYMAHPDGTRTRPGILRVNHANGVTADYKIDAYRLAQLGFNVLAPSLFNMFGIPGTNHIGQGADLQAKHGDTEFLGKMDEAWQYLIRRMGSDPARTGCI